MATEQPVAPKATYEELQATVAALEGANLHLQLQKLDAELAALGAQQALIDLRGPQAQAQREMIAQQLQLRRQQNVVPLKDPAK